NSETQWVGSWRPHQAKITPSSHRATPGPADHEPEKCYNAIFPHAPSCSHSSMSCNAYISRNGPTWTFGVLIKEPKMMKAPGPAAYEQVNTDKYKYRSHPACTFGRILCELKKPKVPGPNEYNVVDATKYKYRSSQPKSPGPVHDVVDVSKFKFRSGPSYTFGTQWPITQRSTQPPANFQGRGGPMGKEVAQRPHILLPGCLSCLHTAHQG
uniref:Outer dense fiber protein 3 n=1 Tax=Denticeps clupeoides TaxID=299321 RepID=A0AAY4AW58_9TELE